MTTRSPDPAKSVIWVYDDDHRRHPFIQIGITELIRNGCSVKVFDKSRNVSLRPYRTCGVPGLHAADRRLGRWMDRIFHKLKMREAQALASAKSRKKRIKATRHAPVGAIWKSRRFQLLSWIPAFKRRAQEWLNEAGYRRDRRRADRLSNARSRVTRIKRWTNEVVVARLGGAVIAVRLLMESGQSTVVVTGPGSVTAVSLVCLLRRRRIVYYPFELYGCQNKKASRMTAFVERWLLKHHTARLITQNDARAGVYRERGFDGEVSIVRNFKPLRTVSASGQLKQALDIPRGKRIVMYEGMLMGGRWLDRLCEAALLLPNDVVVVFVGRLNKWWRTASSQFAGQAIAAGKLYVHGEVEHSKLLEFVADADAGVIIYDDSSLNNRYCAPGKLSDYVFAEVPVVASGFVTLKPLVEGRGIGACFASGDPQDIADAIMSVLAKDRAGWRRRLRRVRQSFAWSNEAPSFLKGVLGSSETAVSGEARHEPREARRADMAEER